ncbi:hypothetical protein [Fischerella thermalis]|uniref:hypothetical protein n=1 Tax=Fischerella thermalis TaxID=372787 RepID=UPI000CAD5548|nr:hypothetical protein [Fischerella thermalis]PMB18458.1 hypothetical protein CEN47_24405 [Fischerella thermalis CCMEE 5319]
MVANVQVNTIADILNRLTCNTTNNDRTIVVEKMGWVYICTLAMEIKCVSNYPIDVQVSLLGKSNVAEYPQLAIALRLNSEIFAFEL